MKNCKLIGFIILLLLETKFIQSQNVGIGNTDPKAKLDVSGDLILKSATLTLADGNTCLLYTSPSPRDRTRSRMPSSA